MPMKTKSAYFTKIKLLATTLVLVVLCGMFGGLLARPNKSALAPVMAAATSSTASSSELLMPNYDNEVITSTNLPIPKVDSFGDQPAAYYPSYIHPQTTGYDNTKKAAILAENKQIIEETKTMYANGTLKDKLRKHVAADGQFFDPNGYDNAPRIEKVININNKATPRRRSLGMFAPAGEIITVTIPENMVGKVTINLGYPDNADLLRWGIGCEMGTNYDRWPNDRMPNFFLQFKLTQTVNYIGSPLGGMVMLDGINTSLGNFQITVSGGVDMPDYKLGVSTKQDWQNILAAPGPYVWLLTPYQYFIMPKVYIKDIADPYQALLWWHKASMISIYAMAREGTEHFTTPVVSIYDNYVYSGEAVAASGAFVTNSPTYWCHGILDYDSIMRDGAWGALHEYNHHYQGHSPIEREWGIGYVDENTNNVLNAATYIWLTDTAAQRSENNILSGWSAVSDPYCNYRRLASATSTVTDFENISNGDRPFVYTDLIHTFGVGKFLDFLRAQYGYGEPVAGYDGLNLTQDKDKYLNSPDGFALFASLFFKTDFTDYFTKIWHLNLSSDIKQKIKSHGFEEYFSLNNLYSVGIKGIETGRPYKINVGTTNVLKINEYTNCSADSYQLVSHTNPKQGKLTDNGDGTFNYQPNNNFTQDSFDLVYQVTLNGKTYTRTLVVKLVPNYQYIERVTYRTSTASGLSVQDAIAQFATEDNIQARGTINNFNSNTIEGNNLTRYRATVVFPFTQEVTFMVYGDDKVLLNANGQTAFTTVYLEDLNKAKALADNKIKVSVKAGVPLQLEAYCFNTGGKGRLYLKYSKDGGEYQDIPSNYCYGYNVTNKQIEAATNTTTKVYPASIDFGNLYLNKFYSSNSVKYTPVSAQCLDDNGNEVKTVNGADITKMFDGDTGTGFHTAHTGQMTNYPHNYYFTFAEDAFFNRINFFAHSNGYKGFYSIGKYAIYTSRDGTNYEFLIEGENTETNFNVQLPTTVIAKYVKLVVKSNVMGKPFTNITEIEFVRTKDMGTTYNAYSSSNEALTYTKKSQWQTVEGYFVNNHAKYAQSGKVKFYVTGTDLIVYAQNAKSKITIDGVTYTMLENRQAYSPSFVIDGLSDKKHLVEIEANDLTLDLIKTTGVISRVSSGVNVVVLVIVLVAVGGVAAVGVVIIIKRRGK